MMSESQYSILDGAVIEKEYEHISSMVIVFYKESKKGIMVLAPSGAPTDWFLYIDYLKLGDTVLFDSKQYYLSAILKENNFCE
jgi:hypothetical protein